METDFPTRFQTITTQDNRITADPIFYVQERRRIHGLDSDYAEESEVVETDDGEVLLYYVDLWLNVQPFFTEQAARNYIAANAHNLSHPRVYAASGHRNPDWKALRAFLVAVVEGVGHADTV